ncbi:hypothetical protein M407DRAFT_6764 [Tulasnella calospora MUT 4182]|uniref:Ubiquitin-like domain-containing protein n=1 Tax=Tulasnella calospora MUT 4182 TaxID=1051891 RepID=A0A0C3L3Z1_9AGAM|nr:hypothetical protein M407DRAFT_6764 [Tulasnella calospora MUT 4182]
MTLSITVKTVQQKQFKFDAEPSDTVARLKEKLELISGTPITSQKLINGGKDKKNVQECWYSWSPSSTPTPTGDPLPDLAALRNHPTIFLLPKLLGRNGNYLPVVRRKLGDMDPALAQTLEKKPELLNQVLGDAEPEIHWPGYEMTEWAYVEDRSIMLAIDFSNLPQEGKDAVEKIVQLGYSREAATDAYLASTRMGSWL